MKAGSKKTSSFTKVWKKAEYPLAENGEKQECQERETDNNGKKSVKLKALFFAIAFGKSPVDNIYCPGSLSFSFVYCFMSELFILLPVFPYDIQRDNIENKGNDKKDKSQGKSCQGFRAVKFLVSDQEGDNLHCNRGNSLERIGSEVGSKSCCHDHNHGFTNGA